MSDYILWQKPYGECADIDLLVTHGRIFCPFVHAARSNRNDSSDEYVMLTWAELRQYHLDHGYEYSTSKGAIERYHRYFTDVSTYDTIYVPRRSYSSTADKSRGYKLIVVGPPKNETINGFSALYRKVKIIEDNALIPSGRFSSMVKIHRRTL